MDTGSSLYTNFTLTPENCDREPIHRPRAIQGHGYMLILSRDPFQVAAISDNFLTLASRTEAEIWTTPIQAWLPDSVQQILNIHTANNTWAEANPIRVEAWGKSFWLIVHEHEGQVILEFEPASTGELAEKHTPDYIFRLIQQATAKARSSTSVAAAIEAICTGMKSASGFDRVMVYQFDEDWHGHVIGEAKEAELEPFLGLHYPATDIPPMARALFLKNEFRSIPDIYTKNSALRYAPTLAPNTEFDLSLSQLRATSPIHIEYLHNMGVRATFTMAIKIGGQLWGLFAFHHYSAAVQLTYTFRKALALASELFTLRLIELFKIEKEHVRTELFELEKNLFEQLSQKKELFGIMADNLGPLQQVCEADGVAFLYEEEIRTAGLTPNQEEIQLLQAWLDQQEDEVYETADLSKEWPECQHFSSPVGGIISCCAPSPKGAWVIWFRQSISQTVNWSGNPEEAVLTKETEQGIRVSPRKSFAKWKTVIHTKAVPWEYHQRRIANRLQEHLIKLELHQTSQRVQELNHKLSLVINKEFEQLVYIASHDLQEPLRTITNYIGLMQEELTGVENENLTFYGQRISRSANRMGALVRDLLEYSLIGRKQVTNYLDLNQLLQNILEDMEVSIEQSEAQISIGNLPRIYGNQEEIASIFSNLLSNALKYRRAGVPPVVLVTGEQLKDNYLFRVQDNGIGIPPEHKDRIFLLFQRLHHKQEFEGTGIGLAQCRKTVELYGGEIWVEPNEGVGSTFFFTLGDKLLV